MINKQIIIDGVDVSGCKHFENADQEMCCGLTCCGGCRGIDCSYKKWKRSEAQCEAMFVSHTDLEMKLKAKEQECDELKKQIKIIDDETIVVEITEKQFEEYQKLKQALTEIKDIVDTCNSGINCSECPYTKECKTDTEAEALGVCKLIQQKCEVFNE